MTLKVLVKSVTYQIAFQFKKDFRKYETCVGTIKNIRKQSRANRIFHVHYTDENYKYLHSKF